MLNEIKKYFPEILEISALFQGAIQSSLDEIHNIFNYF